MTDNDGSEQAIPRLWLQPAALLFSVWDFISIAERLLAAIVLVLLSPLLAVATAVTVILSRKPPFIAHKRVGQNGSDLWVFKLRTMWGTPTRLKYSWTLVERISLDGAPNPFLKIRYDPRVASRFAALCRRHSIDELPQLWQIVCGQLALVGPRPITQLEIETHYGPQADWLVSRKPGLTGLWQVMGRSRLSYHQRRRLDLFMVRKWSVGLYLRIVVKTIRQAPFGMDAW